MKVTRFYPKCVSQPPVLPVRQTGLTLSASGEELPTAVIDATDHPEVADLARVHAVEGMGKTATKAMCMPRGRGHLFLLAVTVTSPVICTFVLQFSLPDQRRVLEEAARTGQLVIATTDPAQAGIEKPNWLTIELDSDGLLDALP